MGSEWGKGEGMEGPHPELDQSKENHLSWTSNAHSCSHPDYSTRLWGSVESPVQPPQPPPGPPVPRSQRPFFSLYLVSRQLLAGPVALPAYQEAFFNLSFFHSPSPFLPLDQLI